MFSFFIDEDVGKTQCSNSAFDVRQLYSKNVRNRTVPFVGPDTEYGDLHASGWFHTENIDQIVTYLIKLRGYIYLTIKWSTTKPPYI